MPETSKFDSCKPLAPVFLEQKQAILARWRARVKADPMIENSPRLSRSQFCNHIPDVLQAFGERLLHHLIDDEQRRRESEMAHQHSRHRWKQGYSLKSLLHEWGDLNLVVLEALDEIALKHQGDVATFSRARDVATFSRARLEWAEMVSANLSEGAAAYNELLQAEALTRVRELEDAFAHAQQFERNRGELLRQTSHDLRGNLSKVVHASELLQTTQISSDERSQVTEILRGGVRSLSQMLGDLLVMSRLEAGKETPQIAPFDAAALLRDLAESSRALAMQKGLELRGEGPDELLVLGDASKVSRIAQNLLLNALTYTVEGHVTLRWERCDERQWSFEVCDTGPGLSAGGLLAARMKQATQEARAVEDEATPHRAVPLDGTGEIDSEGIGLSIVRRLCELLDATLELDSSATEGTRFRVVLPVNYAGA